METTDIKSPVSIQDFGRDNGLAKLVADYSPTLEHSKRFVEATKDYNPLHQAHPFYNEAISPGFMQFSASVSLIEEAAKLAGLNFIDYPLSTNKSEMKGVITTGLNYRMDVECSLSGNCLSSLARILNQKGAILYTLERNAYSQKDIFEEINLANPVHKCIFTPEKSSLDFAKIIGAESPKSNLFAISGSSYVVFDAINNKSINSVDEGLIVLYASQNIYSDAGYSLDLKKGISLELYFSESSLFGKPQNKPLNMSIVGRNEEGKLLYVSQSPISMQKAKLWDIMMMKAGLKRNN